ncbi:MAG: TetR/AcrR family transcriptional regulator [Oscillochloris sp.]|nr:TetR/AcrR family transcriptional regulator [Oscillochloris sp.]
MPRTNQQNLALREESRAKIMAAALQLFGAYGYERTSVRMIAEAAGVAQGLMYSHFQGKDDLLRAIFSRSIADVRESFARAAAGDPSVSAVERLIRAAFAIVRERLDFWRLSYGARMQQAVLAALGPDLSTWTAEIRGALEQLLRESGVADAATEAELLFAAIDGIAQHYSLEPDRYPLDAVTEALIARFTRSNP